MIKLTIDPEVQPGLKNAYVLELTFMHGDADAYTYKKLIYPSDKKGDVKEFYTVLDVFHRFKKLNRTAPDALKPVLDYCDKMELKEAEGYSMSGLFEDLWEKDKTYSEYRAKPSWEVTFFDDKGEEHKVKIKYKE